MKKNRQRQEIEEDMRQYIYRLQVEMRDGQTIQEDRPDKKEVKWKILRLLEIIGPLAEA